jgi:hypothetical protein
MSKPYKSVSLSEEDQDDAAVLATVLDYGRALATVTDHGADVDEFLTERGERWREPVTLGELREFLGY